MISYMGNLNLNKNIHTYIISTMYIYAYMYDIKEGKDA